MILIAKPRKYGWIKGMNRSMKPWLQDNMIPTHNIGKSVVAEGFIRTLRNKF